MKTIKLRQKVERTVLSAVKKVNERRLEASFDEQKSPAEINLEVNPVDDLGFSVNDLNALRSELSAQGINIPSYNSECLSSRLQDLVDYIVETM